MPRKAKEEKSEPKKVEKQKDSFEFKTRSLKEDPKAQERRAAIDELIGVKEQPKRFVYTVEETDYIPKEYVVCLDTHGCIHQEPVPTWCDYNTYIYVIAGIPDRAIGNVTDTKTLYTYKSIDFEADYHTTAFEVKGVPCSIISCTYNGSRALNTYAPCFNIKNGTQSIGGNLVFAGQGKGFTQKEAKLVVKEIIRVLDESSL